MKNTKLPQKANDEELYLQVHLSLRAKKNKIVGKYNEKLKIQIAAPPVDGKANAELIRFLADYFSVPQKQVVIVKGELSRDKLVKIINPKIQSIYAEHP